MTLKEEMEKRWQNPRVANACNKSGWVDASDTNRVHKGGYAVEPGQSGLFAIQGGRLEPKRKARR